VVDLYLLTRYARQGAEETTAGTPLQIGKEVSLWN